ncbi:MAG TPA: hypothetical protein VI451_21140 [Anaerolineales bacterium]|nr:hypothetical protein [Anaerolineales bacterium]
MKSLTRFLALIVAIIFILFLPLSLLGFNVGQAVFNRPLLKSVLTDEVTQSRFVPTALARFSEEMSKGVPLGTEVETNIAAVFISLTQEGWQAVRVELLSDDILAGWVSSSVDSFYNWIDSDDPALHLLLDLESFKARVNSDNGLRSIEIAFDALPACTDAQVTEFLVELEAAAPGSQVVFPPCQFPDIYRDAQLTGYLDSLREVVNRIPDTFELTSQTDTPTPNNNPEGWQSLKMILRFLRSIYWLGLVISILLFALLWLLAIRSAQSLARWGGVPLALAGLLALILSWLPGAFLTGYLVSGPLQDTSSGLREEILNVVSRLSQEVFTPMLIQAMIIFLIGGLILVFVGGIMAKQKTTKKSRQEAS